MAVSQNASQPSEGDIDPNSTLLIRLCISTVPASRRQHQLSDSENLAMRDHGTTFQSIDLLAEDDASHGNAKPAQNDTTRDQVMNMSLDQLELLCRRVQQLELSNYGLLKTIYGPQISAAPFSWFNGHSPASRLEVGSEAYRRLLYDQYRKMMSTARNPEIHHLQPTSPAGASVLREYQMQLTVQAQHQRDQRPNSEPKDQNREKSRLHAPFRVSKTALRAYKRHMDCWDAGIRRPFEQNTALTDYQIQLMALEEQNQRRLLAIHNHTESRDKEQFQMAQYEAQLSALKDMNDRQMSQPSAPGEPAVSPVDFTRDNLDLDTNIVESIEDQTQELTLGSPRAKPRPTKRRSRRPARS
ncbi:uncharacterized protein HMPREF1541_10209 [Cyphellophora europaea CBS 101466]|uniref:Uncharacterized protein n=1 Tax=Cyphellophora europaea (strain CBS 101466) TaxID=1220924 RepID=W2S9F6_CYPE1|nr:uncharacterized protein HMPREF1541_10209 [Cyphellophora europaea CBS 101466]ETN44539.1 hypothetical protein HMPREF1541_10209 [Cyphellophora europaea CBS 101466]